VYDLICVHLLDKQYEHIWAIFLDRKNKVLHKELISTGGITGTALDPNRLLRIALEVYATGIILCHNHPSGSLNPSKEDISMTQKVTEAASLLNIKVLDHLIVGESGYYSFVDEGLIKF
jgi:DNA repair protein RadC